MRNASKNKFTAIIISLCVFAIGVGILYSGINDLISANQAKSWPTTEGTIKSSQCAFYYVMSEGTSYVTHVNYSYSVAGKRYQGERLAFGYNGSWWRRPNQKIADRLSSAKTVLVRYDPEKPAMAVLSCGLTGSTAVTMFTGIWIMLVAAVTIRHTLRPKSKTGMFSLSCGALRLKIIIQEVGGIVLLVVTGLIIAWMGGAERLRHSQHTGDDMMKVTLKTRATIIVCQVNIG